MAPEETTLPTTEDEWRVRLTPAEFRVLRQAGTEPAFSGEYVNTKTEGMYKCRACGAELYPSDTKFDSHCGWPSFDDAIPGAIKEIEDRSLGMVRVERQLRLASRPRLQGRGLHPEEHPALREQPVDPVGSAGARVLRAVRRTRRR